MTLTELRDRIRTKAIAAGLTYTEIEQLSDINSILNQTLPCILWDYRGTRDEFNAPHSELTLRFYLFDNFHEADKSETSTYQRDYLITKKAELEETYYQPFVTSLFTDDEDYLHIVSSETFPIPERQAIESFMMLEANLVVRIKRGWCIG